MFPLLEFIFGPRVYGILTPNRAYQANLLEYSGNTLFTISNALMNSLWVLSPIILPYTVFHFNQGTFVSVIKFSFYLTFSAYALRTFGRVTNSEYRTFIQLITEANTSQTSELKKRLKEYDYQAFASPIDYLVSNDLSKKSAQVEPYIRSLSDALSWFAVHTFGKRMLFPGALDIVNALARQTLIDGRRKYITLNGAQRNILITRNGHGHRIDSIFIDNRGKTPNGQTLVICCDGNAGFYEAGMLQTPLQEGYSAIGFGESTGNPMPGTIIESMEAVMEFAAAKTGFSLNQIVLYGWSLGGFPAAWAAANYPDIKGLILDASFDDLVPLAISKMPASLAGFVETTVRKWLDLPISKHLNKYFGPILLIRRRNDEIIITADAMSSPDEKRETNRANYLLIDVIKNRHPEFVRDSEDEEIIQDWLKLDTQERLAIFGDLEKPTLSDSQINPQDREARHLMIRKLCTKYFFDLESTHNIPLPPACFYIPTAL